MSACPHGMPSPKSCIECMEEGPVEKPARWVKVGEPFTARFNGTCSCGTMVLGDQHEVQRWDKGDRTAYTHAGCAP